MHPTNHPYRQTGFLLLPVVVAMVLLATIAFLLVYQGAMDVDTGAGEATADQARYVAQGGLQHALWVNDHSACSGGFSIPSTPLAPGSYSATVSAASTATSYTLSVDQDAWLKESAPAENHGTDLELSAKDATGDRMRALYRFDLGPIPSGAQIASATAWFYVTGNDDKGAVEIHAANADWTETGANWGNMGSAFDSAVVGSIPIQTASGVWVAVNLTAQVQAWINGASPNYGLMFLATSNGVESKTASREALAAQRPWMEVTATTGSPSPVSVDVTATLAGGESHSLHRDAVPAHQPAASVVLQPGATEGEDVYLYQWKPDWNHGAHVDLAATDWADSIKHSLLRFDLGTIPVHAKIISAALELYSNTNSWPSTTISVYRMNSDWTEGSSTGGTGAGATWNDRDTGTPWNTPGGDYEPSAVASAVTPGGLGWVSWDVTSLVGDWVNGGIPNYGLLLAATVTNQGAEFHSSDAADPTLHPRLIVTYACECGIVCLPPQGAGTVLMVVINPTTLVPLDAYKKALFESWGYTVTVVGESENQATYDSAIAAADVVFISETVNASQVGNRLVDAPIGVVSQDGSYNNALGIASGSAWSVGSTINVTDTSHYITAVFPAGALDIYSAGMEQLTVSGTTAPGLQTLADSGGAGSLVVLDAGAMGTGGAPLAGRRVLLPLGRDASFNWDYLNNNGRLMVQRALQWGTGNTGGCAAGNLRDEFNTNAFNNSDGTLNWAGDWIEIDSAGTGTGSGKARVTGGELRLNGTPLIIVDPGTGATFYDPSLTREADLSAHLSATLSFDFRTGSGVDAGEDSAVVEVSGDGGASWTVLEDFIDAGPSASGSRSYDISPYIAANTQVRFRINILYGGPNEYFYVDNLDIAAGCSPPPALGPIAHWKLDETSGTTALDSAGGHDGTLINGPTWTTGQDGGALDLDGANDYLNVPHDAALSLTSTLTFTAWINPDVIGPSYNTVLAKDSGGAGSNYWFGLWQDELVFGFFSGATFREVATSGLGIKPGGWQHVAASFDNGADEVRLYLDGAPVYTGTMGFSPTAVTADLTIGRSPDNEYWRGLLDDIRIYDRVLGPTEIAALAAGGGGGGGGGTPPGGGGCDGTFRDEFLAKTYAGSDGTLPWASDWLEINESDGPQANDEQVKSDLGDYSLRVQDNDGGGEGVMREADLSGAATASLSFEYRRKNLDNPNDYVAVWVSANGDAGPWTELDRFAGSGTDGAYQTASYDISAYASANTRIRFLSSPNNGNKDEVYFDNIEIQCTP